MTRDTTPRVVVSGVGAVSAWGWGTEALWQGLCTGRTAIGDLARFDPRDYPTHIAAEVPLLQPAIAARVACWARLSHADRFGVGAALEALDAAGLPADLSGLLAGAFFGSSTGGMFETEGWYAALGGRALSQVGAAPLAGQPVSSPGEAVARILRLTGPVETVASACASATLAIENALAAVRHGEVDVAIAGGSDSLCRVTYGGFNALGAVDPRPCVPFRSRRRGLSLGEGAAVLVLERADDVLARGARPRAELVGAGCSADAHHMTAPAPDGDGAALALRRALHDAGLGPDAVDFVNAHGTGTDLNDRAEHAALERVFGGRLAELPLVCNKGSVGHLLGSAGAIEAVATVLCLREGVLPPAAEREDAGEIDPATPVCLVRHAPRRPARVETAVSLNLAFGGCNGALVLRRWDRG